MAKLMNKPAHGAARKSGARKVVGRPVRLSRANEQQARHAVRRRPPLHERLAARVKKQTKRWEPPKDVSLRGMLRSIPAGLRDAVLINDPRDVELSKLSNEPIIALVGAVDLVLLLIVTMLIVVGTVMIYSSSMNFAYIHDAKNTSYYLFRQTQWLLLGIIGMYVTTRIDYHRWRLFAGVGLAASIAMLLLLHTTQFGHSINGSQRWLHIGSFDLLQPSEVAKIALILYAAHWFAGQRPELRHSLRGLLPFAAVIGLVIGLIFIQPDLGTTIVIVASLVALYFVAGARARHLAILGVVAIVCVELYLRHLGAAHGGYQSSRLDAYKNCTVTSVQANCWQINQAHVALGSGGLTGVGLGNSQIKETIPEPNTDSIFAIIGEEWGLFGTMGVLVLFLLFALRGLRASILAPDAFGRLLAAGLTCSIVFQALVNMAVIAGLIPFTGVPLPFISYGGSSLSVSMVAAGILLSISKKAVNMKEERDPASTYLWWRNRRAHLPVAGRRAAPLERSAVSRQPSAGDDRRDTGTWRPRAGRRTAAGSRRPVAR